MGRQENSNYNRKRVNHPFCPFKKFCVFLRGEDLDGVLTETAYLRKRVDELEFGMDFTNHQVKDLQARIKELEDSNSQLKTELSEVLQAPFNKYPKKDPPETQCFNHYDHHPYRHT